MASNSQIAYCLATTVEGFTQERRPHLNAQASAPASPSSSVPRVLWRSACVQVVRAPTELTRAIFCSDVLSLWLALTIRIGWWPHWQGISCALQSPRTGLLYCHFLEGRKQGRKEGRAGRKEGWLACAKVFLFTSTSSDTPRRTRILFNPAHMRFQSMYVAF